MGGVITGGEAAVRVLQAIGVDTVFGIPSVHNLPIVDALARLGAPRFVVTRHEQGAGAMADGFARARGGLGVCLTSTGPGACNSVSAMYEADLSGAPVLQVTGQVPTDLLDRGTGTTHEIRDQPGMFAGVTKAVLRARTVAEIPGVVRAGASLALSAPTGPVVVELPIDLQYAETAPAPMPALTPLRPGPDPSDVAAVARELAEARRPVIVAGGGAVRSGAREAITALAERLGAPVLTTRNGRGAIDEWHRLCVGPWRADPEVQRYVQGADVCIGFGTRFRPEMGAPAPERPSGLLVQVNADPRERDRIVQAGVFMACDARLAAEALVAELGGGSREPDAEVGRLVAGVRERALQRLGAWGRAAEALEEILPRETILVRDVTVAANTLASGLVRLQGSRPSTYTSGAAIGLGLPMALGAAAAEPDRPVVAFCGDGGFVLNSQELATAVQHALGAVVVLFNDRGYEVLRRAQDTRFGGRRFGTDLHTPDFAKLCEAYGVRHLGAGSVAEVAPSVREALRGARPAMVEVDLTGIGAIPR